MRAGAALHRAVRLRCSRCDARPPYGGYAADARRPGDQSYAGGQRQSFQCDATARTIQIHRPDVAPRAAWVTRRKSGLQFDVDANGSPPVRLPAHGR